MEPGNINFESLERASALIESALQYKIAALKLQGMAVEQAKQLATTELAQTAKQLMYPLIKLGLTIGRLDPDEVQVAIDQGVTAAREKFTTENGLSLKQK